MMSEFRQSPDPFYDHEDESLEKNITNLISLLESPVCSVSNEECNHSPQLQNRILQGVNAFVEVRSQNENRSKAIMKELVSLGSTIETKLTNSVTHVIYKDGRKATRDRAKKLNIPLVSVLWVDRCKETGSLVPVNDFPAILPEEAKIGTPRLLLGRQKKCKSMQPKDFDEEIANSAEKYERRLRRRENANKWKTLSNKFTPVSSKNINYAPETQQLTPVAFHYNGLSRLTIPDTPPSMKALKENLLKNHQTKEGQSASLVDGQQSSPSPIQRKLSYSSTCLKKERVKKSPVIVNQTENTVKLDLNGKDNSAEISISENPPPVIKLTFNNISEDINSQDESFSSKSSNDSDSSHLTRIKPIARKRKLLSTSYGAVPSMNLVESSTFNSGLTGKTIIQSAAESAQRRARAKKHFSSGSTNLLNSSKQIEIKHNSSNLNSIDDEKNRENINSFVNVHKKENNFKTVNQNVGKSEGSIKNRRRSLRLITKNNSIGECINILDSSASSSSTSICLSTSDVKSKEQNTKNSIDSKLGCNSRRSVDEFNLSKTISQSKSEKLKRKKNIQKSTNDHIIKSNIRSDSSSNKNSKSIVFTSLHYDEQDVARSVIKKLGGFTVRDSVDSTTTHLICGNKRRTLNILYAIVRGCWVVSLDWIFQSLEFGRWVSEDDFEINSDFPSVRTSRQAKHLSLCQDYSLNLFGKFNSIYVSDNSNPPQKDLIKLIELSGGKVTSLLRNAELCIGTINTDSVIKISEQWILDSITSLQQLSFKQYVINS